MTGFRTFQLRVIDWMMETFSMETCRSTHERNHRFLEESLELVQSLGCTAKEAHMLVDYVYGRPVGEPQQEVGGVMVTIAALCAAADIGMSECAEVELARCWKNIDKIRAKQAGKPPSSPLPGPTDGDSATKPRCTCGHKAASHHTGSPASCVIGGCRCTHYRDSQTDVGGVKGG